MIDDLYDLVGGKQTVWDATGVFLRILADDTLRPFFKSTDMAQLRNYAPGKACLSRCFWGDEPYIRARIPMPLMRMRESKG